MRLNYKQHNYNMETKIDWSKIDKKWLGESIALGFIKIERKRHQRFKEYWNYQLFTPMYVKLWHKLTFKKIPKL